MKAGKLFAAALLGLGAAMASSQASAQGFYMGASFGSTDADRGNAVPALITSGSVDGSDSGIKLFGGFAFNKNIAVEMAFVDLGELAYSGICCGGTPVTNGTVETSGFNFAAVGTIPLNPSFSLFGKLGMFFWEAEASDLTGGFPFVQTIDDVDISYGFGASYQFNRNFGVQVEWEQYEAADSISLLSVGVVYRF
jgi:OOP family OmpA-OmpF porin